MWVLRHSLILKILIHAFPILPDWLIEPHVYFTAKLEDNFSNFDFLEKRMRTNSLIIMNNNNNNDSKREREKVKRKWNFSASNLINNLENK